MPAITVPAATYMALTRQAAREGVSTRVLASRLLADGVDTTETTPRAPVDDTDIDDAGFPLSMTGRRDTPEARAA